MNVDSMKMRRSSLADLVKHVQRSEYFLVGPRIELKDMSVIPHLKNGRIKLVLDVFPLIESKGWTRSNLLYTYRLFVAEVMKNNTAIYLYNSGNEKDRVYHRTAREILDIGSLIGIANEEQILT